MSYINRNKPISGNKKKAIPPGIKKDLWIFNMISQSKGNSLPLTELRRKAGNTSIYKTLDRLSPKTDDIQETRLFCYNDLIRETEMSDGDYDDLLINLRKKIEESYNHFLQWQNWRRIKPIMIPKEEGIKLIKMQYANNDLISLKLIPNKLKDRDKAILIFRKRRRAFIYDDTSKYTHADIALLRLSYFGLRNSDFFSFQNTRNYVRVNVPLVAERKETKLYFRTLSERSYYSSQYSRRFLDRIPAEHGDVLRMNVKGLLSYALEKSNYKNFNKSLENLAESDEYKSIVETIYRYNKLGQTQTEYPLYFKYSIKREFPFLSYYNIIKEVLPSNFAAKLLKKIATKLKYQYERSDREYLKCIVSEQFFEGIKKVIETRNYCPTCDDAINSAIKQYIFEISTYLKHEEIRSSTAKHNMKILSNIKTRRISLAKKLEEIIKNNENNYDNQVIPIDVLIRESRLLWLDLDDIVKSLEERFGKRFIITDRCIITKSKVEQLRSALKENNKPTYDYACHSLIHNGVPKSCISEELFHKLGFQSSLERSNSKNVVVIINRKKEKKLPRVYHDHANGITEVRLT